MKKHIDAGGFCKSIGLAFEMANDVEDSIARVKKTVAALPDEHLYYAQHNGWVSFHKCFHGKQKYVSKSSKEVYALSRRRYLQKQLEVLELTGCKSEKLKALRKNLIRELQQMTIAFAEGNLNLARIVMNPRQYKWFTSDFRQKKIYEDTGYYVGDTQVRSKSERDILRELEGFALPVHYEEETSIQVQPLVDALYEDLREAGQLNGKLFYYKGRSCIWRVPKELEIMNSSGSIWPTYDNRTGRVTIYDDFRLWLASNELMFWEHDGLHTDAIYRYNAGERSMILKSCKVVPRRNLIETFEDDVDSKEKVREIIISEILPRVWF